MVDALVVLESRKSIQVLLTSTVHPEDVKVVVLGIAMQTISDVGGPAARGIKHELAVDWRKHVSTGQEQVVLVLGNLANNWVPAHGHVDDESTWAHFNHLKTLFAFLVIDFLLFACLILALVDSSRALTRRLWLIIQ